MKNKKVGRKPKGYWDDKQLTLKKIHKKVIIIFDNETQGDLKDWMYQGVPFQSKKLLSPPI